MIRALLRLLEREKTLAAEAVVAHRLHRALDAAFVARAAHARGVDVKATRLRVLEKRSRDARRERIHHLHDALGGVVYEHAKNAAEELPRCLARGDRRACRLLEADVRVAMSRANRSEDPCAEATPLAEEIRLEQRHPAGVELQLLAGGAVGDGDRRRGAAERQLRDGEAVQRRVGHGDAPAQEQPPHFVELDVMTEVLRDEVALSLA